MFGLQIIRAHFILCVCVLLVVHSLPHEFLSIPCAVLCLVAQLCPTIAGEAPLFMGFPRQEYWSGLPFPSPGDLPNPGIEPRSPVLQADSLPFELQGRPQENSNSPKWPKLTP